MEIGSRVLQECVTIVHFFLSTLSIVQWMGKYDLLYVNTVGNGHIWLKVSQMVNLTFLIVVVFFSFLIDSLGFFCFILYGILWYGFGWVTKNQKKQYSFWRFSIFEWVFGMLKICKSETITIIIALTKTDTKSKVHEK